MKRSPILTTIAVLVGSVAIAAPVGAEPPRPGCGYGDTMHAHQAAPGLDDLDLRPGRGTGDDVHPHTAPPGQSPADGGDQSGPMRGCQQSPLR
ncbi:MAG: hypothetical protein ABIP17_16815 [Ilumatobacteraceae bacterium]